MLVLALVGCGGGSGSQDTVEVGGDVTETRSPEGGTEALVLPEVGLEVGALPDGFEKWQAPSEFPRSDGGSHWYQQFHNDEAGTRVTLAVTRDLPVETHLTSDGGEPVAERVPEGVGEYPTYFFDFTVVSGDTSIAWAVDETTMGWVIGSGLSMEELLAIAESVWILPSSGPVRNFVFRV